MSEIQKKLHVFLTIILHLKILKATRMRQKVEKNTASKIDHLNLNGIQHVRSSVLKTFSTKEISTIMKSIKSKNSRI
jgi:hypothetical protein